MLDQNDKRAIAGHAIYSRHILAIYDLWVLGVSNRFIWKCPTELFLRLYNAHLTANHLEIGVGTGYFLDYCVFPDRPRLVLLDLNENSLNVTAKRISRYHPKVYQRNILDPLNLQEKPFTSIGMNYLLHCLPGTLSEKAIVFDRLKPYLRTGGTVFGSTLLQGELARSPTAQWLMNVYNRKGIFCNDHDDFNTLKSELAKRFSESHVTVHGCAALFWGKL